MTGSAWAGLRRRHWAVVATVLAAHAGLLAYAAARNSVTFDEFAHLPAGLAYWHGGHFNLYCHNPPLIKMWAGLPALVAGARTPEDLCDYDHFLYGRAFLNANFERYHAIFFAARSAIIALSCALGLVVFVWARRCYGLSGGLLALILYAACPNVCAHAGLATVDLGAAFTITLAACLFWKFLRRPLWRWAAAAGVAAGLAVLSKFSALLLGPTLFLMVAYEAVRTRGRRLLRHAAGLAVVGTLTLAVVNAGYGFTHSFYPLNLFQFQSRFGQQWQQRLNGWRLPLPADFLLGFDVQKEDAEAGKYHTFILDEIKLGSVWYYYPVALAVKTPVGTLGLVLLGLAAGAADLRSAESRRRLFRRSLFLVPPAVLGVGMTTLSDLNIGIRYLLPCYPFVFVWLARLPRPDGDLLSRWRRKLAWALCALAVVEGQSVAPRYLTFFNRLAGGSAGGIRYLNDSNLDWGQGLIDLKEYMDDHGIKHIQLAYFGMADPRVYGIDYEPLHGPPKPGWVGVSSYFLVGLSHTLPTPEGRSPFAPLGFFKKRYGPMRPTAVVGNTLYLYHIRGRPAVP